MTATIIFTITVLILVMAWGTNRATVTTDIDKILKRLSKRNDKEIDKIKAKFKPNPRYKKV